MELLTPRPGMRREYNALPHRLLRLLQDVRKNDDPDSLCQVVDPKNATARRRKANHRAGQSGERAAANADAVTDDRAAACCRSKVGLRCVVVCHHDPPAA